MSHLPLHRDGNFWPQAVCRDGKEYSAGVGEGWGTVPSTLTAKCRLSPDLFLTDSHWGQKYIFLSQGSLPYRRLRGQHGKRFAGPLQFACTDFCISAGCRGKELNLFHENIADICIAGVWGISLQASLGVFFSRRLSG